VQLGGEGEVKGRGKRRGGREGEGMGREGGRGMGYFNVICRVQTNKKHDLNRFN